MLRDKKVRELTVTGFLKAYLNKGVKPQDLSAGGWRFFAKHFNDLFTVSRTRKGEIIFRPLESLPEPEDTAAEREPRQAPAPRPRDTLPDTADLPVDEIVGLPTPPGSPAPRPRPRTAPAPKAAPKAAPESASGASQGATAN